MALSFGFDFFGESLEGLNIHKGEEKREREKVYIDVQCRFVD